jgi:hypothetical protein
LIICLEKKPITKFIHMIKHLDFETDLQGQLIIEYLIVKKAFYHKPISFFRKNYFLTYMQDVE